MKHKITQRLIAYFSVVLLLFALISALFFSLLFARHTAQVTTQDLLKHAASISSTLSQFVQDYHEQSCRGGGFKAYLRFMSENSTSDLYLLDKQGTPMSLLDINPSTAVPPDHLLPLVDTIFSTGKITSTSPSSAFSSAKLAAGAPIFDQEGNVRYALILHASVNNVKHARMDGLFLLTLSLGIALFLTSILSIALSRRFVMPLRRMMDATAEITAGHYGQHTGVSQNDEIGILASHIDALSTRLEIAEQERFQLEQMRQNFFSDISHELRNPITVLKGSIEVLRSGMLKTPADMQKYYDQLYDDTHHLQRLINDLLELSRLQSAHFLIEMECVNLIDILLDTMRSMRLVAERKQISLRFDNDNELIPVMGDYGRLRQLITILVDNAIKFSPEGSSVSLCCKSSEQHCIVSIIDHGIGMDKETLSHIFDRYFHNCSMLNHSGTGLGLPIAREIALRHKIDITCESIPYQETRFTLSIPTCNIPEQDL